MKKLTIKKLKNKQKLELLFNKNEKLNMYLNAEMMELNEDNRVDVDVKDYYQTRVDWQNILRDQYRKFVKMVDKGLIKEKEIKEYVSAMFYNIQEAENLLESICEVVSC